MVCDQVIGSGMIATAFKASRIPRGVHVYAAGVSNSSCTDQAEFERDAARLKAFLDGFDGYVVYISTTSVEDKPYTHHKHAMEALVRAHGNYLICRLPVVAGRTTNPHTLLNFLHDKVKRRESFTLYAKARRNIIDVMDVVAIVEWLTRSGARNETVNVAAPRDYSVLDIVRTFEEMVGRGAVYRTVDIGDAQDIDVRRIADAPVYFGPDYLDRTLRRYYA